jgi:hypothetical protein
LLAVVLSSLSTYRRHPDRKFQSAEIVGKILTELRAPMFSVHKCALP